MRVTARNFLEPKSRKMTFEIELHSTVGMMRQLIAEEFEIDPVDFLMFLRSKNLGMILSEDDTPLSDVPQLGDASCTVEVKPAVNFEKVQELRGPPQWETKLPLTVLQVKNIETEEVRNKLVSQAADFAKQALVDPRNASFRIPSRSNENIGYDHRTELVLLGSQRVDRSYRSLSSVTTVKQLTTLMKLVNDLLSRDITSTKRDLFYMDVKAFGQQSTSDSLIEDLGAMLEVTRNSLHVVAGAKGLVVGRVSYRDGGDLIDCTKMGKGGKNISPNVNEITDLQSDAEFVLVVEKEAAFLRLSEDRFYEYMPSIIVTAKGQPDMATRMFIKRLREELELPVLGLMDADPYGLDILRVYALGSKALSFESVEMAVPDIKWLGLTPSDLENPDFNIPASALLKMSPQDKKRGEDMLKEEFVKSRPVWKQEITAMVTKGIKAEIQALNARDPQFLTNTYLPTKISAGDFY